MLTYTPISSTQFESHRIYFIEGLPLLVRHSQGLCRLDGALHVTRPHLQVWDALTFDVLAQSACKLKRNTGRTWVTDVQAQIQSVLVQAQSDQ